MRKAILILTIICALNLLACANTDRSETRGTAAFTETFRDSLIPQYEEAVSKMAKAAFEWKTDMDTLLEDKMFLADMGIHPLYAVFLRNEINVANPYAQEGEYISPYLSFFDDRDYAPENVFQNPSKYFALVDVNQDGNPELAFKICDSSSELLYLLGVYDNELICFDVFETHTSHIGFGVYDNGNTYCGEYYMGVDTTYYTYTNEGTARELIHFVCGMEDYVGYYYLEGDETAKHSIASEKEYLELDSHYRGETLEWYDCESFIDIPKK